MESPRFSSAAIPTSNGAALDTSHPTTTESSFALQSLLPTAASTAAAIKSTPSTPPVSSKVVQGVASSHISKLPSLVPQTKLTGEAALASRHQGLSPNRRNVMSNDSGQKGGDSGKSLETSPNPATILTNYSNMSRTSDAPVQETLPVSQKVLGGIVSAAHAIDTSGSTASGPVSSNNLNGTSGETTATAGPSNATDPSLLQPHAESNSHFRSVSPIQPLRASSISETLSATTPTTPFDVTTPTTPFSPSVTTPGGSKGKHMCPHCNQIFTRHHNLKSHLFSHSHEKPFICSVCQARFRRLHDLKRHSKLHTGERPHVCHKCGRKFARGDALARHARAEGGCAGRRSSMAGVSEDGSMGPGLVDNEDGMEGLEGLIDGDPDGDVDMIGGSDGNGSRRRSLPSIRTDFSTGTGGSGTVQSGNPITPASGYTPNQHHNTYPGLSTPNTTASTAGPSPAGRTGLFPPHLSTKSITPTSASPMQMSATTAPTPTSTSGGAGDPTSGILSPSRVLTASPRDVSPALTQPQESTGGGSGGERNSSFTGFMGSLQSSVQSQQQQKSQAPAQQQPIASGGASGAPTASMGGNNMFAQGMDGVWGYVKGLEDRVKSLEGIVDELKIELRKAREEKGVQRQD